MKLIKALNRLNEAEWKFGLDVEPDATSLQYYSDEAETRVDLWVYDTRVDNGEVGTGYAYCTGDEDDDDDVIIVIRNGRNGDGRCFIYHPTLDVIEELDY